MKWFTTGLFLLVLLATSLEAQGESVSTKGEGPPHLEDLPLLSDLFRRRQDENAGTTQGRGVPLLRDLPLVRRSARGGVRAEKRLGEPMTLRLDPEGRVAVPTPGFGARWLCERILGLTGVRRVEIFTRIDVGQETRERDVDADAASRREGGAAIAQRYLRIDAEGQSSLDAATALIEARGRARGGQILFEVVLLSAEELPVAREFEVVEETKEPFFLREMEARKDVTVVQAPSVLTEEGADAEISLLGETSYVRDYQVTVLEGSAIADPVVGVIRDGIRLRLAGVIDRSTGRLHVGFELEQSWLQRPIKTFDTTLDLGGTKSKVTVQLPELQKNRWASDEIVLPAEGGSFVVRPWGKVGPDGKATLAFVKVKPLAPAGRGFSGAVRGVVPDQELAYVEFEGLLAVGDAVKLRRGETEVGAARVASVAGSIAVITFAKEISPEIGDTIH